MIILIFQKRDMLIIPFIIQLIKKWKNAENEKKILHRFFMKTIFDRYGSTRCLSIVQSRFKLFAVENFCFHYIFDYYFFSGGYIYFLHWYFDKKSCFVVFCHEWNEWKNPQFNFSSQNLSIERNFSKWDGKVTKKLEKIIPWTIWISFSWVSLHHLFLGSIHTVCRWIIFSFCFLNYFSLSFTNQKFWKINLSFIFYLVI